MKPSINQNLSLCLVAAGVLISQLPVQAVDFHVATAQDLQNALTLAAANGADDRLIVMTKNEVSRSRRSRRQGQPERRFKRLR